MYTKIKFKSLDREKLRLNILFGILLEALSLCDSVASPLGPPTKGCWVHKIPVGDGKENVSTVCITDLGVTLSMYYANPRSKPTTCRQAGVITPGNDIAFAINFDLGYCENGHGIAPDPMRCIRDSVKSITCKIGGAKDAWIYYKSEQ